MNTNSDLPENRPQGSGADSGSAADSSPAAAATPAPTAPTERLGMDAPAATTTVTEPAPAPRRRPSKRTWIIGGAVVGVLALGGAGIAIADEFGDGSDALDDATRDKVSAAALAYTGGGELLSAERDDDGYDADVRLENGTEVDLDLDAGFAVISSDTDRIDGRNDDRDDDRDDQDGDDRSDDDGTTDQGPGDDGATTPGTGDDTRVDDDAPLTAAETTSATDAALAETGEGEVVDIDRSDDRDHAFEVEVRLTDGSEVDVHLDADFGVVSTSPSD